MSCKIIDYTEKSIAVIGETKEIKNELKLLGGKYNPNLKDKDGNKMIGWIFSNNKKENIEKIIGGKKAENIEKVKIPGGDMWLVWHYYIFGSVAIISRKINLGKVKYVEYFKEKGLKNYIQKYYLADGSIYGVKNYKKNLEKTNVEYLCSNELELGRFLKISKLNSKCKSPNSCKFSKIYVSSINEKDSDYSCAGPD